MAVMLMGIGVVTLATLFPISILRSIQATQLTNATILRYNAETTVQSFPEFVLDPDFDPNTAHDGEVYVFDPLGWHRVPVPPGDTAGATITGTDTTPEDWFGNDGTNVRYTDGMGTVGTRRYEFFFRADETDAEFTVTLQDSWRFVTDAVPVAYSSTGYTPTDRTSITLPSTVDLTNLSIEEVDHDISGTLDPIEDRNSNGILDSAPSRIDFFSSTGRGGHSRIITRVQFDAGTGLWTVIWSEDQDLDGTFNALGGEDSNENGVLDMNQLPNGFVPERVRIFTQDERYSWMMTVRNSSGIAAVNVVVFFKRSFETQDEFIHRSTVLTRPAFQKDSNIVRIDYTTPKPYLRKGSYVFDPDNGHWYRIQDFTDDPSNGHVDITVSRPAVATSNAAILMKDIVEVFPIDTIDPSS